MPKRKNINDLLESIGIKNPVEQAQLRPIFRLARLKGALASAEEPEDDFVLATRDGRSLAILPDKSLGLDVGDDPDRWSESRAKTLAERWNRDAAAKDHVEVLYWRVHYTQQIARIEAK